MFMFTCIQSCAADESSINALLKNVFGQNTKACAPERLEGRYVLAYHEGKLVGMHDICGQYQACVLENYRHTNVTDRMQSEARAVLAAI